MNKPVEQHLTDHQILCVVADSKTLNKIKLAMFLKK